MNNLLNEMAIPDQIDEETEEINRLYRKYEQAERTGKCPECGSKDCEAYEVTASRNPDDCDIDGVRFNCRKCNFNIELDF